MVVTDHSDGSIPLVQAVREYLDWQALDKGRSPNTVRAYQQDLAKFVTLLRRRRGADAGAGRLGVAAVLPVAAGPRGAVAGVSLSASTRPL